MTRIYFFKSNGLTQKDQVKMTKVGTSMLSDTAKRRQKVGNETATSDKVIIRTPLGHFLRYVAMIFAVLVMSMANIGMAWGTDYSSTPLVSLDFSSSLPTVSGVTYHGATYSSGKISWSGNYSNGTRDVQITFTTTGSKFKVVLGHITSGSSMTFKYRLDSGSDQNWTLDKTKTSDEIEISASAGSHTIALGPAGTSTRTVVTSIAIYDEASGSTWYVKGGWNNWGTTTQLTGDGTTLTATASLSANTDYEFKIFDSSASGDAQWWGNTGKIGGNISGWVFNSPGSNCHLLTTEAGTYTFSFNTSTKALSVTYPNSYTFYYGNTSSWSHVYVYKFTSISSNTGNSAAWPGAEIASPAFSCGGTDYYAATSDGYGKLIFTNNSGNQTGDMVVSSSDAGKYVSGTGNSWSAFSTYTISFAANGGSSSMSSISDISCGSDQAIPANSFTAPSGKQFAGWKANVDVKVGGVTKTAGTLLDDEVTIQDISSNITLTAQWELIPTYDVIYNTNGGTGGSTASQTGNLSGAQVTTSANGFTKTGYKFKWWNTAANGSGEDFYPGEKVTIASADVNLYAQWEQVAANQEFWTPIDEASKVTGVAISKTAGDMSITSGGATDAADINVDVTASACIVNKYNSSVDKHAKVLAIKNDDKYIEIHFTDGSPINKLWLGATPANTSSKNIVVVYSATSDFTTAGGAAHEFKKVGSTDNLVALPGNTQATKSVTDVSPSTENTYYYARIYRRITTANTVFDNTTNLGSGTTVRIYSIKAQKGHICAAPTELTVASTTAKGTTFTVTDGDDTNNYEFYVSTESTAPTAGSSATYTSTSKTKTIDDLYAGTQFYAWVRSNCGVYGKSGWTALTGSTFTTSTVSVTHTLTNVTATSGATGANAAGGSDYTAVFAAVSGYSLPAPAITIDGNAAESGTDYTWTQGTGTVVIPANKITGDIVITIASAAAAPSSVAIGDNWLWFAGETMTLTATPTGGNGPVTYQWYYGGKEDGNAIEGATNATFSKTCAFSDAGSYYCKVTCGGSASTWGQSGNAYDVKIPRLYVKTGHNYDPAKTDYGNVDFTRATASTATASISLGANWDYCFNIADGCGHYYGNAGTMQYNNYGPWTTNVNGTDCGLRTTNGATYVFTINYSNWTELKTTVTFPSSNQAADKVIYFDNSERQWTNVYYRIGHTTHVQASAMDKVYGTANLYTFTTTEYNNFMGWHITNATGETGSNTNIYNTVNSPAISEATAHEGGAVTQEVVTVTPTTSRGNGADVGVNNNCEFFNYDITSGMKTDNVAITAPSNGTITVSYTDVNNAAQSFTSGNRDLAHTVILTSVTATPATGYDLSSLTINEAAHTSGNPYTCSGATTIAATFSLHNYNVTYSAPGNGNNYTIKVADGSATSESKTATMGQTITIVASPAAGYDFTGWTISKAGGGTVTPADASATTTTFTMPTDDVTITASFTLKTYTVNFAASPAGYGSVSPTSIASVNHGSTVSIASNVLTLKGTNVTATPTAAGADYTYAFSGWSVSNGAAITESQTITANFTRTANQYSVTHSLTNMTTGSGATGANAATYGTDYTATLNANSGYSRPASITVTAGATDITANCTWNQSTGAVTIPGSYIMGNITITAAAVLVYTVTFDSNGGSAVSPISQASTGASITMPAAPTYADHTFQGWVIGGTTYAAGASYTPTANITAYATWKADCAGGGGGSTTLFSTDFTESGWSSLNNTETAQTLTIGGHSVYVRANQTSNLLSVNTGSGTLTWGARNFSNRDCYMAIPVTGVNGSLTITVDNGSTATRFQYAVVEGSTIANPSSTSGSTSADPSVYTAEDLEGTSYVVFLGRQGSGSTQATSISITTPSGGGTCYYVTYDGNGAESGSISDATAYASGANVTVLGNTGGNAFTKAGYEFTGWNTLANGTGTPYSAGGTISGISGNVTLFAQWGSPCSDPDDPSGLAVGSITSSGATFTITDDANTNNYEIVCKTTSGTPAADATPTQTGTSKTIAVTGLDAYTDYYAYVRSVCNASHKSSWVALTGAPFKTLCEDPTTAFANGDYTIGGSALDLRTLISSNNSGGAITYSVTNANGTGATIAGDGYSFSATIPGTAYVRASQAANGGHCAVVLDATVTVAAANTCVTIAYFEETAHNNSSSKPDGAGKYLYGYDNSAKTEGYAYTLTTSTTDNKGQGTGASDYLRMNYGTTVNVYADNTTTGGTPESWSDVTSVSVDFKMKNSSYYTTFDIKVGNTTIADDVSLQGDAQTGFTTFTYNNLANLDGKISIINNGSGSSNYHFYVDNIRICTSALTPCTTPVIPSMSDQTVCPGSDIAAWDATVSNAAAISAAGESVAYSWKKKGSDTELVNTASLDLGSSATEGQSGTYVVTVTVSADGKASASASKEVTLTVTPATETPSITASKAKVYATDEVTLTATCGSTGITWNWYLCANSDGTGAGSSLGTSATYTIASAPAAGTYYYKAVATGDGTHSCGTAEYVYTLVVSAANSCDKEFWFAKEGDRPTGAAAATHITGCPSGSSSASYTASIDGTNYTLTGSTGQKTGNVTIVVPADNTGTLYVVVQGSSSRTITLSKGGTQIGQETPENSTWGVFTFDNLDAGTYNLVSSGNISWAMMTLKLCPTVACTDDTPTAAATNATVCAGGSITITATGYETGATFQWQKQNASTSVWEDIDDATSDTYTVTTAAAEHAGNYHIVATKNCARTSNTVTIAVPSAPVFNSFSTTRRIMETQALAISDVSATDAVSYKWYKSANSSLEAGDPEIGSSKELMKAYADEAIGTPSYYVFCVATNSCGADTTSAIAVNVTAYVEQDCAVVGSSGEHNTFGKTGSVSSGTYGGVTELHTNSSNKYLQYVAEDGYYFKTAKVNACVNDASSLPTAAYSYSTDGGANWTDAALPTAMTTAYADHVIDPLPANVNAFRVGRKLGDYGSGSGTLYIHEVCFEYSESCTSTTVTASPTSKTHTIGDSFTKPTFTVKHGETTFDPQPSLTYTSSNEDIATVDDDGTVNFQGMTGTVTITASFAGGTISATEYCASSGSYTITVSCSSERPKIVPGGTVNMSGCNPSVALNAKMQDGTSDFSPAGTYQWYRDGEAISGATSASYTARQAGIYTVSARMMVVRMYRAIMLL